MKKFLYSILLSLLVIVPFKVVMADGISLSDSTITVYKGESKNITISAVNTVGIVDISSSNTGVAKVSPKTWETGSVGEGQTKKGTIKITGVSLGTATISFKINAATFGGVNLKGQIKTVKVTVTEKPVDNRSTNTNLASLTVDGNKLTKENDEYKLEVNSEVASINIEAKAEDEKAKVSGTGTKNLNVGENTFNIVVTAENGKKKTYTLVVTKKDGYYLEDVPELLKSDKKEIEVKATVGTTIPKSTLDSIKSSKKKVTFNTYDENNRVIYSWEIDGSKLTNTEDTTLTVTYDSEFKEKIEELSNYACGVNLTINGKRSEGISLKVYVGKYFPNDKKLNIYEYKSDNNTLVLNKEQAEQKESYINIDGTGKTYFVTRSKVGNAVTQECSQSTKNDKENKKGFAITDYILPIIELVVIIGLVIVIIKKSTKKDKVEEKRVEPAKLEKTEATPVQPIEPEAKVISVDDVFSKPIEPTKVESTIEPTSPTPEIHPINVEPIQPVAPSVEEPKNEIAPITPEPTPIAPVQQVIEPTSIAPTQQVIEPTPIAPTPAIEPSTPVENLDNKNI